MAENIYNGIINVYKEPDFTSFDVVAKLRGIAGQKKIGHTGTLDPMATGVLPVCLGNATKVCGLLTDWDKEYVAELLLGVSTDTLDVTGTVLKENRDAAMALAEEQVKEAAAAFCGEIRQVPPMYSALKVNGQRLYDLARKGETVERQARPVTIHELEILEIRLPVVKMRVLCSKGTYIRTLCEDIGERLGCGGTMQSLVRTKVGPFTLENARKLADLQEKKDSGHLSDTLQSVDSLFLQYPACTVLPEGVKHLENGNKLMPDELEQSAEKAPDGSIIRVYRADGRFAGLYRFEKEDGLFHPEKMFL